MSNYVIARRYAQALYALSSDEGVLENIKTSLDELELMLNQVSDLKQFISNPLLTFKEQTQIIHKLFDNKLPTRLVTFLDLIASKRRLDILMDIINAFGELYRDAHQQILVYVHSAQTLEEATKNMIINRIQDLTKKTAIAHYTLDPSMIGGVRVLAAGRLYEYSFNGELQDYKRKVLA